MPESGAENFAIVQTNPESIDSIHLRMNWGQKPFYASHSYRMTEKFDTTSGVRSVADMVTDARSPLGHLLKRARDIENLNRRLSEVLGPSLENKVCIVSFQDGNLVLVAIDSTSATQLRTESTEIAKRLEEILNTPVAGISIKVDPDFRKIASRAGTPG